MTGNIKFSITVPVYNVEKYIDECIQSVISQGYENFELILVDDGSKDRSGEICDAWAAKDSRIKVYHKPNAGLVHTRSYALARITGDYCVFLDSDDYIYQGMLEKLSAVIQEYNCDCVVYGVEKKLNDTVIETIACGADVCGGCITDKRRIQRIILSGSYNSLCRKCVRAKCFDGRDYSPYYEMSVGEDLVRTLEILERAESYVFIPDIFYVYRCNIESIMRTICYDGREADNRVDMVVDEFIEKFGVLEECDINAVRNGRLDNLAVELRRRARHCSSFEASVASMKLLRDDKYISDMVETGYRSVSEDGTEDKIGLRKRLYRINIALFRSRKYKLLIFMDKLMQKLNGK